MAFITSFAFDDEEIFFTPERHNKMLDCGLNVRYGYALMVHGLGQSGVGLGLPDARGPLVEQAWCRLLHMATNILQYIMHICSWLLFYRDCWRVPVQWILEEKPGNRQKWHSAVKHIILHQMESLTLRSKYKGRKNGAVQELGGKRASHWCNGV